MRNIFKKSFFAMILIIGVVVSGCSDDESSSSSDAAVPDNTIQFTYDGTDYIYQKGNTDSPYNGLPFAYYFNGGDETNIKAYLEVKSAYVQADKRIVFYYDGNSIGDQSGNNPVMDINIDGISGYTVTNLLLNITTYDEVDGWLEGEFSGTFEGDALTDGKFKVKRIADF